MHNRNSQRLRTTQIARGYAQPGVTSSKITGQTGFPANLPDLIGNQPPQSDSRPRASINWIILDEQFKYVSGGFDMVGDGSINNEWFKHHNNSTIPTIAIPKNGYLYVYCSNESQYNVFFDNLQLIHSRGPLVEEIHYYPFGLTMAGISSKALNFGDLKNRKGYAGNEIQHKEFSDDSGLELYDFNARTYDQQFGRFIQIDPLSEDGQESWSLYHYSYNNPATFSDPDGKIPIIPLIIIGIGLLTASKPAIAPTGRPGEARAIQQAYNNYNTSIVTSFIPGGRAAKPSQILYQKAANEVKKKVAEKTKEKVKELTIDGNKHPEAAKHAKEAIDNGASNEGVVDRAGSSSRRKENTKNVNTEKGKDRDEFPPAVIKTEGGVSVKLIPSGDNRGAGGSLGQQLRNVPDNARVVIKVIEPIKKN